MNYMKAVIFSFSVLFILAILGFKPLGQQLSKFPFPTGDTVSFRPNRTGGWGPYTVYLNQDTQDSVEFELILKQYNRVKWKNKQFIGTITNTAYIPKNTQ